MYAAGTILRVDFGNFYHYGIADGAGGVIHNSKKRGKVTHESEDGFSGDYPIEISEVTSENPSHAVIIAKRYLSLPYNLFSSNCEHFVRLVHELDVESPQLQRYLLVALGAGIAIKSDNYMLKAIGGAVALASLLSSTEKSPFKNVAVAVLVAAGIAALVTKY